MPVYAIGFSDFQCTLLLVVSVEVVPLGSLEGAIDMLHLLLLLLLLLSFFAIPIWTLLPPLPPMTRK